MIEENGSCKSFKAHCDFWNENVITVSKTSLLFFHTHFSCPHHLRSPWVWRCHIWVWSGVRWTPVASPPERDVRRCRWWRPEGLSDSLGLGRWGGIKMQNEKLQLKWFWGMGSWCITGPNGLFTVSYILTKQWSTWTSNKPVKTDRLQLMTNLDQLQTSYHVPENL